MRKPSQLLIAERAHAARFEIGDVDKADEMHAAGGIETMEGMRDRRGAPIRGRRSHMPARIWWLKTPVCGARMSACAWSGRF